jgi:hypothetical protein
LEEGKNQPSTEASGPSWSWKKIKKASLIGGLFSLALGVVFFINALTGVAEGSAPSTFKRTRWLEDNLGKTGTSLMLGLAASGIGLYYIAKSFEDCYE